MPKRVAQQLVNFRPKMTYIVEEEFSLPSQEVPIDSRDSASDESPVAITIMWH